MADFTQIIQEINADINTNGVNAITGAKLNKVLRDMIAAVNDEKQDPLTIDATPNEDSTNPVQSGGVYDALEDKADKVSGATNGNIASFDANGNIQDSGIAASDVATTSDLAGKQDTISDLATIRSGAAAGATAYQKPQSGIPSTDFAAAVQTSLGKADTAVQQVTVGTTTTGNAGTNASVNNSGTATAPVLNFTIPRGADGADGQDGADAVNPFKGWYDNSSNLPANPVVGDYAYVKGATISDPVAIYECTTAGTWSDSGRTFNPANNQEFASGEDLNTVHIVNDLITGGEHDVLSAEQGAVLFEDICKKTGKYNFSFYSAVGEHGILADLLPFDYIAGTTIKGKISLGTAAWNENALAVYLIASDGTTLVRSKNISMDTDFELTAGNDASFISFYIWKVTTAGTFIVDLKYGGLQHDIEELREADAIMQNTITEQSDEIDDVEELVLSGFDNGAFSIGGTEIGGSLTIDDSLLLWNTGKPYTYVNEQWKVKKYPVTPGTFYHVVGSTNYGNAIFSVIDNSENVLYKEKGATNGQEIIDKIYRTPTDAAYIYVAYVTGIKSGRLSSVEIAQNPLPKKWIGKKWVAVGDSLTEHNARALKNYLDYIHENTGITIVNMGLSGSGYRNLYDENKAFYQRVANVPTDADVVTIFGSGNDLNNDIYNLGDPTDTGTTTICGCINSTLDTILSVYMTASKVPVIGVITPTPWINNEPSNNGRMSDYSAAIIECCKLKSIPVLDLFHCSNLHPNDATFRSLAYSRDGGNGVHPDERGHQIISPMIENFLEGLIKLADIN